MSNVLLSSINLKPYFVVSLGMHGPHSWDLPLFRKIGVNFKYLSWRRGSKSFLNQWNIEGWLLMHSQINLIKFVESKFDKAYSKIWNVFVWSNFLKICRALIPQISWMKNKPNFKSPQRRKNKKIEL